MERRTEINFENAVKTVETTIRTNTPCAYDLWVNDNTRLSILTGSHAFSSAKRTVEVALMVNDEFCLGDTDTDDSIIHYLDFKDFKFMIYMFREFAETFNKEKIYTNEEKIYTSLFIILKKYFEEVKYAKITVGTLKPGLVIWYKTLILGITGMPGLEEYVDCEVTPVGGNEHDYELTPSSEEMERDLIRKILEQENGI